MKFNFRKIASVITGAVMLSSTVAFAAAANFPAPFVKSGAGDYAVVYGSTAVAGTDNVAAADINAFLTGKVTTTTTTAVTNVSAPTDGDFVMLEKSNNKFNLGDSIDDFQTSLDNEDLPVILADGTYTNGASSDFDYEQSISLGQVNLSWQQTTRFNDKKPYVGFNENSGVEVLNYTLDFTDNAEGGSGFDDLDNTVINMLGRDYYISDASVTSHGVKLTLLDTANAVRITEGDTQTVTVGDKSYQIKVVGISGTGNDATVSLSVDGVELSNDLAAGETAKVKGENTYVGVKKLTTSSKESVANTAVITVGTGRLVLENGQEVELNDKVLSDLDQYQDWRMVATVANSSTDITSIKLTWLTDDKVYLKSGQSWVMPGFEAIKLSLGNFVTPTAEETILDDDSDSAHISTVIQDGDVDFSIFNSDDTDIQGLGSDTDDLLVTAAGEGTQNLSLSVDSGSFFAATWIDGDNAETYMFRIKSVGSSPDNETVLENMAGGSDITLSRVGDDKDYGEVTFTLEYARADTDVAQILITPSSGDLYSDRVATKGGLVFRLPVLVTTGTQTENKMNLNATSPYTGSWTQIFSEATKDGDLQLGKNFTVTWTPSTDGTQPDSISGVSTHPMEDNSDIDVGYVVSDMATYVSHNNPSGDPKDLKIEYHPTQAYAEVYVTESTVSFNEDGSSSGGSSGTLVVKDSEVTSVSGKNLIVVGGSCVNTVAAKLLGSDSPLCGDDWTAKTNAGAGAFLIETYANPWSTGKVATLVAGYDATDSTNAVNALKTETIDTTVGKKYVKLAGSTLQLV